MKTKSNMTVSKLKSEAVLEFDKFLDNEFDKENKVTKGETHRWIFCEDKNRYKLWPKGIPDDCGCCLDDGDHGSIDGKRTDDLECGCHCHYRIGQIKQFLSDQIQKAYSKGREEEHKICVKTHLSELERWCIYDPTAPKDFEENYLSIQSKGKMK